MNILIINGSPKGEYSITLQTALYIAKHKPSQIFEVLHAGQQLHQIEKDPSKAMEKLEKADLLLFSYPVYTFLVPSQLHRFIELIKESKINLQGKYAAQITTSKHFYDMTAHRFIQDNCNDLGFHYVGGLSADMDDLLKEKGQKEALDFWNYVEWCIQNQIYEPNKPFMACPCKPVHPAKNACHKKPGRIAIVADIQGKDSQLKAMIDRFRSVTPIETEIINLREFPFKGGCISCFNCAISGKCVYKDGFDEFLRTKIQTADAIAIAFQIQDHSMGARFKMYDDRQFCNGHRTVTAGMPFAYLVSGKLSQEENLKNVIEARAQVGGNFLAGIASDEIDPDTTIDQTAAKLCYAIEHHYTQPANFWGVGGMKIFRDLIWLMQGMMKADHRFYREHGLYDFPQKSRRTMLKMYLVGGLIGNPSIKKKMGNKMNEGMIAPYRRVLEK